MALKLNLMCVAAIVSAGSTSIAQNILHEVDVAASAINRSGDAINSSGSGREDDSPSALRLNLLTSVGFDTGFAV